MNAFEDLQKRKVELAEKLRNKLLGARGRLAAAEELKKHELVKDWLLKYAGALKELQDMVKDQRTLCPTENQCNSLLQEEIDGLGEAIRHLQTVATHGVELNEFLINRILIILSSRAHSLPELLRTAA